MKKYGVFILFFILLILLCSCEEQEMESTIPELHMTKRYAKELQTNHEKKFLRLSREVRKTLKKSPYEMDVYELARKTYGMDEYSVDAALKLITFEGYWMDPTYDYFMACSTIVHWAEGGDIYRNWGGADFFYCYENLQWVGIADHAISSFRKALINMNWNCWEINGLCPENGYYGVHSIYDAWYATNINGMWFGVWGKPEEEG